MGQEGVTREDFLTLWDVIKRLYRSHVRANADRAALLQILREELNESSDEVLSRLEEFHESDVYQRELHDCEKTLLPIEESIRDGNDLQMLAALAKMPVSKSVN